MVTKNEDFSQCIASIVYLQRMIAVFRHKFAVCLISSVLFLAFGLKTTLAIGSKWSSVYLALEDEAPSEEDQNAKEEKTNRTAKKMWYFEMPEIKQTSTKDPIAWEAHNKVYLLAIISEPHIAIPTEPPEFI
ncbi:MAG: hypothetical protein EOO92_09590 [Pedobacter sp.]|nr:MAG: hypothetical protein EOO92_09590 [Pedobacter sp.]